MKFSVLFWNIWLDNQISGPAHASQLLDELQRVIDTHKPDCIGLNEVLQHTKAPTPFVLNFLQTLGYIHTSFVASSPLTNDWLIGAAIASKHPLHSTKTIVLGNDTPATRRGYTGNTVKAIATKVQLRSDVSCNFMIAHPTHLRHYTLKDHYVQTRTLTELLRSPAYAKNTILGGDFNEPRFMPKSFTAANSAILHHRTGTIRNPTWRFNASRKTIIRANLDKLFWTKESTFKLEKFIILNSDVSGHRPLFARFIVPTP